LLAFALNSFDVCKRLLTAVDIVVHLRAAAAAEYVAAKAQQYGLVFCCA
jgi:hypothetical protein